MPVALRAPGWWRALEFTILGVAFSYAVTIGLRALFGYDPLLDGEAVLRVATAHDADVLPRRPGLLRLLVLLGLRAPDAPGGPLRPRRVLVEGLLPPNTDHKVIGIQYVVTSFFFLFVGGLLAMLMRAELAAPGRQFVDANTFNGLFSVHASLLIFLFVIPVFAGPGELRAAADDRRAGHGLPAPERAVLLDAAAGRHDDAALLPGSRRLVRQRLDGLRAAEHLGARSGRSSSPSPCSSRARRRSPPR